MSALLSKALSQAQLTPQSHPLVLGLLSTPSHVVSAVLAHAQIARTRIRQKQTTLRNNVALVQGAHALPALSNTQKGGFSRLRFTVACRRLHPS